MTKSPEQDSESSPASDEPNEEVELDLATGKPLSSSQPDNVQPDVELVGLGGWLILIGLHVIFSILATVGALAFYLTSIPEVAASTEEYPSGLLPVLAFDCLAMLVFFLVEVTELVFFFKKHRLFPKIYIGLTLAYIVWPLLDSGTYWLIAPDEPVFDPGTIEALVQAIFSAVIWISYMLQSKRVANTFVN